MRMQDSPVATRIPPMSISTSEHQPMIYSDITKTIGNTPLVRLNRMSEQISIKGEILLKLEFFNPMSSVKDRIGLAMIEELERQGKIGEYTRIIEPTSGNTGIALAFVCAAKGYRLILCMPESMSVERRKMLQLLGAELELTPAKDGMAGSVARAQELLHRYPDSVMPQQFDNPANPRVHFDTTAEELWCDTDGDIDAVVAGIGTGGTITGIARALKPRRANLRMVAVEPEDSAVLSGRPPGVHKIQGIGAGFIPANLDTSLIDEVITIGNETAFETARQLAKQEGITAGISSGAAVAAGLEVAGRKEMTNRRTVVILPSFAERYLSTALFEGA